MNNKGFAVSTILYGLSIMGFLIVLVLIGLMASNRSNTKDFVMQVEDELNRFSSKQTEINFNNNTNYPHEYFTLDGTNDYWYKIELWNGTTYRSATFKISPNTLIYFYIGDRADIPTIACIDGESRDNCTKDGGNLILSTTGESSGGVIKQDSDAGDSEIREVYVNQKQNEYGFDNAYPNQKVRVSLSSMDEAGGFLKHPNDNVAGVFYLGSDQNIYTCNGSTVSTGKFTGDQNQQWTIINGTATNVKYNSCTTSYSGQEHHNALF